MRQKDNMASARLNKRLIAAAFFAGMILMWLLFQFGLLRACGNCHVDIDSIYLSHTVQCKSQQTVKKENELAEVMTPLLGPAVSPSDPKLLRAIRDHFLEHPRPYLTKFSLPIMKTPQATEVDKILSDKTNGFLSSAERCLCIFLKKKFQTNGFFVECGALDGERSSNTNWLEQKRGWNGLLIEMDPSYYMQVRGKNRKSMSINACLSPHTYSIKMDFKEHHMGQGRLVTENKTRTSQNAGMIHTTYCFPLYSLMMALNRTKIDYFSLDVEGMEIPILKTIPFDKLDITVLSVEYNHGKEGEGAYVNLMKSKGYKVHKRINYFKKEIYLGANDYIFVKDT